MPDYFPIQQKVRWFCKAIFFIQTNKTTNLIVVRLALFEKSENDAGNDHYFKVSKGLVVEDQCDQTGRIIFQYLDYYYSNYLPNILDSF